MGSHVVSQNEQHERHRVMARKPTAKVEVLTFNVMYEDGTQLSNRRIPGAAINQFDRDNSIRAFFEAQDAEIAERSGRPRGPIKDIEAV
jgi:hypothetical protein